MIFQYWVVIDLQRMCEEAAIMIFQFWVVIELYRICEEAAIMIFQYWAVIDLYGMCEEVAINESEGHSALVAENLELRECVTKVLTTMVKFL